MLLASLTFAAEPTRPARPERSDTLYLKNGKVLPCRVDAIGTDGKVRFRTPLIDGAVSALPAHVKRLEMTAATVAEGAGALAMVLTNGDRVIGTLVELTDDVIVVDSPSVGEMEIPRPLVRSIMATSGGVGAVWSDFASGLMIPWKIRAGAATVRDGALQSLHESDRKLCIVSVPLKQTGVTTIQAVVGKGSASTPGVTLWLHATGRQQRSYRSGIAVLFKLGNASAYMHRNGVYKSLGRSPEVEMARNTPKVTYTMAYDSENCEIKVWINAKPAGKYALDTALPVGQEVAMYVRHGTHILRATVRPGMHAPLKDREVPADKGRVVFKNGDSWLVTRDLTVADGRLTLQTPDGELRCPFENVARIDMPVGGRTTPKHNKADVRVRIGRSLLTMQLIEMTETTLRGRSDYLGELRLPRKLVCSVEF